jgi:putative transposase
MASLHRWVQNARKNCAPDGPVIGKQTRFTEEQIIKVLKEHAAGLSAGEVCRKYGISDATFYKWRSRYGGMEVSDARRLKALEDENRRLKKLLAESMLDASTLKEMLGKNF